MKLIKMIFKIIGIILLVLIVLLLILNAINSNKPLVKENYEEDIKTGGTLEKKYFQVGKYKDIEKKVVKTDEKFKNYSIYYPKEISNENKKFPVIVIVNGSGTKISRIENSVKHFASWGFIVIGTDEQSDWEAYSSEQCLKYLIELNKNDGVFKDKIDLDNIGVLGHSQGGVGAINAGTNIEHSNMIKTIVVESPTNMELAEKLNWNYDPSKINVPTFLISGTEKEEVEIVVNDKQLKEIYDKISENISKIMVRRTGANHDNTNQWIDGYITSWFMWYLQNDEGASKSFVGDDAEIINNKLYQDLEKNF